MTRKRTPKKAVQRTDTSSKAKLVKKKRAVSYKTPKTGVHKGIPYESTGEFYFICYCLELKALGYIERIERGDSIILLPTITHNYSMQSKRKSTGIHKSQTILRPLLYTPDFKCVWNKKAIGKFIWLMGDNSQYKHPLIAHKNEDGELFTLIENKPDYDFNNKTQYFVLNQKLVYDKYKLYVNLVKPSDFFAITFTPKEYLLTSTGKARVMKYIHRTLKEYIEL